MLTRVYKFLLVVLVVLVALVALLVVLDTLLRLVEKRTQSSCKKKGGKSKSEDAGVDAAAAAEAAEAADASKAPIAFEAALQAIKQYDRADLELAYVRHVPYRGSCRLALILSPPWDPFIHFGLALVVK